MALTSKLTHVIWFLAILDSGAVALPIVVRLKVSKHRLCYSSHSPIMAAKRFTELEVYYEFEYGATPFSPKQSINP